jgi:hypothetical protein
MSQQPLRRNQMTVNKERVELWAQALESEKYVQCYGALKLEPWQKLSHTEQSEPDPLTVNQVRHCVLGVAMEVARLNGLRFVQTSSSVLPEKVSEWYGFDGADPDPVIKREDGTFTAISAANDVQKLPFWNIAQLIRANYLKGDDVQGI